MEIFYSRFTQKTLKLLIILFCFLGDFSILLFFYMKFNNFETFKKLISIFPFLNINMLEEEMVEPLFAFTMQSLVLFFFLLIIIHSVVYILFWYEKKSAMNYIKILSLLGAPSSVFFVVEGIELHVGFAWFIVQTFLYAYCFFGFYYFKKLAK